MAFALIVGSLVVVGTTGVALGLFLVLLGLSVLGIRH